MEKENIVILFDIDHTIFDTEEYYASNFKNFSLHSEVVEVLQELSNFGTIGIFSEGERSLQELKLLQTKVNEFFKQDYIHIVERKKDSMRDVISKYKDKKLIFVDDRLDMLQYAKQSNPNITVIWLQRGYYADKQNAILGFSPDARATNLKEAGKIIKLMLAKNKTDKY